MATTLAQFLYILAEDLYRLGNYTSPKLHNVRPRDVDLYDHNGILMVTANGRGISLLTEERVKRDREDYKGSYLWKLPCHLPLPPGLALAPDIRGLCPGKKPDHYLLCPRYDMPLSDYVGLLSRLAGKCERMYKL